MPLSLRRHRLAARYGRRMEGAVKTRGVLTAPARVRELAAFSRFEPKHPG